MMVNLTVLITSPLVFIELLCIIMRDQCSRTVGLAALKGSVEERHLVTFDAISTLA